MVVVDRACSAVNASGPCDERPLLLSESCIAFVDMDSDLREKGLRQVGGAIYCEPRCAQIKFATGIITRVQALRLSLGAKEPHAWRRFDDEALLLFYYSVQTITLAWTWDQITCGDRYSA